MKITKEEDKTSPYEIIRRSGMIANVKTLHQISNDVEVNYRSPC